MGVPIIRTIVFGGRYWGPLVLGSYHFEKIRTLLLSSAIWGFQQLGPCLRVRVIGVVVYSGVYEEDPRLSFRAEVSVFGA